MKKLLISLLTIAALSACNSGGVQQNSQKNHPYNTAASLTNSSLPQPVPSVPAGFENDSKLCQARSNSFGNFYLLVGTVVSNPVYKDGMLQESIELSHTHFHVLPLGESNPQNYYDVAADNVFAGGYDQAQASKIVPAPLTSLTSGTTVELCGITYADEDTKTGNLSNGIHWVHIGNKEMTEGGWAKTINQDGSLSDNLESNTEYLYLWPSTN